MLDELQEILNDWMKKLTTHSIEESWIVHSPNVMTVKKSINFERHEFSRKADVFDEKMLSLQNTDDHVARKALSTIQKASLDCIRLTEWVNMVLGK